MNRNEFRFAFNTLPFLDSHKGDPAGVLKLRVRPTPRLLVWHPEGIDWIFRVDRQLRHLPSRSLRALLGQTSLLGVEGVQHAAYRRVLGPMLRGHRLQTWHNVISHAVHAAIDALAPGAVINLIKWTRRLTFCIISQIVLGRADSLLFNEFDNHVESMLGSRSRTLIHRYLGVHAVPSFARRSLLHKRRDLDEQLLRSAKAALTHQSPTLAALLVNDGPLGVLDDGELRDQIMSLLFAGYETTASATAWALYCLSGDEGVRRDVIDELATVSNDGSNPAQVPLLHAVTQETLRLFPPAFIAGKRMLNVDGELLGKPLPAGTTVTPCIYLAHHQPDLFPNPHQFNASRFLGSQISQRYYLPFGGGIRRCLGSELAMLEIRMITAAVLRRCQLHCVNAEAGRPKLRGPAMTLAPSLQISVTPHRLTARNMFM